MVAARNGRQSSNDSSHFCSSGAGHARIFFMVSTVQRRSACADTGLRLPPRQGVPAGRLPSGLADSRWWLHQNDSKNYALTKDQFVAHIENQDNGFDFDFSAYRLILGIIEKIVAEADRKNLGQ